MSELKFDEEEDRNLQYKIQNKPEKRGIADLLITIGIAKDKQQANFVMIGIIVVMAIIFFISISSLGNKNETVPEPIVEDPSFNP